MTEQESFVSKPLGIERDRGFVAGYRTLLVTSQYPAEYLQYRVDIPLASVMIRLLANEAGKCNLGIWELAVGNSRSEEVDTVMTMDRYLRYVILVYKASVVTDSICKRSPKKPATRRR
jgi:hypothetical protein